MYIDVQIINKINRLNPDGLQKGYYTMKNWKFPSDTGLV